MEKTRELLAIAEIKASALSQIISNNYGEEPACTPSLTNKTGKSNEDPSLEDWMQVPDAKITPK
jgi:hypothetical protein